MEGVNLGDRRVYVSVSYDYSDNEGSSSFPGLVTDTRVFCMDIRTV